ncbi:ATP-grasp domain-containing protein [Butyrivibrio sp. MC2013]|uniref:ATP-grasp domain-containing protein n=1 Tax=Butyrivibrio sp. MC2013 TaxID=1280686 RepID=UPI0003FFDADA|nr:ATP-grasp domain-containing protein [Butyrivibrio sp. MC2013]
MGKKIVVFNTSSTEAVVTGIGYPGDADCFDEVALKHPDYDITVISAKFFFCNRLNGEFEYPKHVSYVEMPYTASLDDYVEAIKKEKPDILISVPTVSMVVDWNSITEAIICEKFEKEGVKTYCHSLEAGLACYDKASTHEALTRAGINNSGYVRIDCSMYKITDKSQGVIKLNVYREYIKHELEQLHFPVIMKDNTGSSSLGLQKVASVEEALSVLDSDLFDNDLIAEEYISGDQYTTEIHGCKGHYSVLPPFVLSMNSEGITDSARGIKFGPVWKDDMGISELQDKLKSFAGKIGLNGVANVDLAYHDGEWYVIEINPRWSGATMLMATCEGRGLFDIYFDMLDEEQKDYSDPDLLTYGCIFRVNGIKRDMLDEIRDIPYIKCYEWAEYSGHVITAVGIGGAEDKASIYKSALDFNDRYPGSIIDEIMEKIRAVCEDD